ncbi:MAG: hypothetical protein IPQ07_22910 [Myxococcales bacterium]|nr:hypothetical protein [Myxococcales bacterium]
MRVLAGLLVWLVVGTAAATPKKKPSGPSLSDQMETWRKDEGATYDQFQEAVAQARKRLDKSPGDAGAVAGALGQFIDGMSLQLNVALRAGMLRETDKIPTKSGALTGPQMLKALARTKRQISDLAVKAGDKAAMLERIAVLERSFDWQQRLPAALAGFEKVGRIRSALATATSGVSEATRFAKLAAETRKIGGVTNATQLKVQKRAVPLSTALTEVEKLGRQAAKERARLAPLAAAEQKRADDAHRAARTTAAPQAGTRPGKKPGAAPAAVSPAWNESPVSSPIQTEEGDPPVEASPEPAAEEAPAESAAPAPEQPRCNPTGATCGNANPPDDPCCAGSSCVDRFQYSDGDQGIGHCS